jgi:hypothetical protein
MRGIILLLIMTMLPGCTASVPYAWQDTRQPTREDATADLEECRAYTARQYRPGMPAGEPYLKDRSDEGDITKENNHGQWGPGLLLFPTTNINAQPIHEVPVDYTGYPGELDYSPGYLDAILEKCMHDRGWGYKAVTGDQ